MGRLPQLDLLRGVAVVAMVCWHTADSWLSPALKQGEAWNALRSFGGMAAPLFVFLAGAGVALASGRQPSRGRSALARIGRGLEIVMLGYLLRVQTWLLDAGALFKPWTLRSWVPLLAGCLLLWWGFRQLAKPERARERLRALAVGVFLVAVGLAQVDAVAPGRLSRVLQIDVLQAIGASVALVAALLAFAPRCRGSVALVGLGGAVALLTPLVWRLLPGALPVGLAGVLGTFPVAEGAADPSRFPLFPWLAYALVGAGWARWIQRDEEARDLRIALSAVAGATIAVLSSEAHPHVYLLLKAQPWLAQPIRVLFRLGVIGALALVAAIAAEGWPTKTRHLLDMGRASLRIYWAHLPLAYGVLGNPLKGRLDHAQWGAALGLLMVAMWLLSTLRISGVRAPAHT